MPFSSILEEGDWSLICVVSPASFSTKSHTVSFDSLPRVFLLFHMRPVCLLSLPLSSLCSCLTCINAIQARCGLQVKTRHGPELNHTQELLWRRKEYGGGKRLIVAGHLNKEKEKRNTRKVGKEIKKHQAHCETAWMALYSKSSPSLGWKQFVAVSK